MLAAEERAQLLKFVSQSTPGTPYLRRARIILLDDEGASQEAIAAELQVPITRVRQMLRAYKREGAGLFPVSVWSSAPFRADDPITYVARQIVAELTVTLEGYAADLESETSVIAVHESRKTTRKMRTALRLFEPYFQDQLLRKYRKRARKFMRRLAHSRDTAVFLLKLDAFSIDSRESEGLSEQERSGLADLANYWRDRQYKADLRVRDYFDQGKFERLLADLNAFGRGEVGEAAQEDEAMIPKAAYIAPAMIYHKLANVRIASDQLGELQPERLHALRIACKELRYTLEFFEGLLGPGAADCLETVKLVLLHLGDVNDARIHLQMLDKVDDPQLASAVELYREAVREELRRLREGFPEVWAELDRPEWRERLASAVAVL